MAKIDAIDQDSIDPNTGTRTVEFKVKADFDLDEALAEHAAGTHLEEWSRAE